MHLHRMRVDKIIPSITTYTYLYIGTYISIQNNIDWLLKKRKSFIMKYFLNLIKHLNL